MLAWAAYLLVVSGIMSLAALSLERAIRRHAFATRWIWACALFGSLVFPLVLSSITNRTEVTLSATPSLPSDASHVPATTSPPKWSAQLPIRFAEPRLVHLDGFVEAVWLLSSGIAASILVVGWWYGYRRRRHWRRASLAATDVLVSQDAGPATVGLLHPQIVLPEWLLGAAPESLQLVIAHERSHVEARDPALLGFGLSVAVLMPWNVLAWWQVNRLRLAIEVDCDRRVLSIGHDARRYARTLVDVSTRRPTYPVSLAASPGSLSSVERRIILMNTPKIRGWRASTAAGALLSVGIAAGTLTLSPPAIPPARADITSAGDPSDISRYAGNYEFSGLSVLRIGLQNGQLTAAYPGSRSVPLTRMSGQEFRFGNVDAYLRFATDAAGRVIGVVLQQNGVATEAPRIDAQRELAINGSISERVRDQAPTPGSMAALRRLITGIQSGNPNYAGMSPQVAGGTRAMLTQLQATMRPWGTLRSIEFRGVNRQGWDQYLARFDRGTASWQVEVDPYGLVVGVLTHPGQ